MNVDQGKTETTADLGDAGLETCSGPFPPTDDDNVPQLPCAEEGENASAPAMELPVWFIRHCVTTSDEWKDKPDTLLLRETTSSDKVSESSKDEQTIPSPPAETRLYEMASVVFEPLRGLVRSSPMSSRDVDAGPESTNSGGMRFTKDIWQIFAPMAAVPEAKARFLKSAVKQLAKSTEVDLITLSLDDLQDLADHFNFSCPGMYDHTGYDQSDDYWDLLFNRSTSYGTRPSTPVDTPPPSDNNTDCDDSSEAPKSDKACDAPLPFSAILAAPNVKRSAPGRNNPLIVHLVVNQCDFDPELLADLRKSMETPAIQGEIMVIISTERHGPPPPPFVPDDVGTTEIAPIRCTSQEELIIGDSKLELRARNIRALQSAIRKQVPQDTNIRLVVPYSDWTFLDGTDSANLLQKTDLSESQIEAVVQALGEGFDDDKVKDIVLGIGARAKALQAWNESRSGPSPPPPVGCRPAGPHGPPGPPGPPRPPHGRPMPMPAPRPGARPSLIDPRDIDDLSDDDKWINFPPSARKVIRRIDSEDPGRYYWERRFLALLVDPKEVQEGWADIAIDPETEKAVRDVVSQHHDVGTSASSYGVLKRSHVGGALVYGPPGTGKTHLARVLSRESGSTVICASPADIEHTLVGDTPKAIQGLFNLGKLLAPSIIFIDEADSLFRARGCRDHSWTRSQLNQLLAEMDGLSKSKTTPFVLLSTNCPGELDPAALRRVPSRIHLPLPSTTMRAKIFDIILRDEILHSEIDSHRLALMTRGFSGSDIRYLCIQAAIMCDTKVEDGKDSGKRLLTRALFEKALERAGPSVSRASLAAIRSFAMEHDPRSLSKMVSVDVERNGLGI